MLDINQLDLAGKTVLEVGCGRGGTTRELVGLMAGLPGARLVVTDLSDRHFERLTQEFRDSKLDIKFVRTDACELDGIEDNTIDCVVCNYTLCAVNAQPGRAALALERFWQVLKPGGTLFVEEEYPIGDAATPAQTVWAEKWRILKAAMVIGGRAPYNELEPDTLAALCRLVGFHQAQWEPDTAHYGPDSLDFFQARLDRLLPSLLNDEFRAGFAQWASALREQADQVGGMEVPFYRLAAQKG
jgi:SAM-dependent methyltransferase